MPSTIGKRQLFRIKYTTLLEGETFFSNKHQNAFFLNKVHIFLVGEKTPLKGETFLRNKYQIAFFEIKCTFFGRRENFIRGRNILKKHIPNCIF